MSWGMDLSDHTPQFGQTLPEGKYLVEVAGFEESSADKGDRIRFTFKVVEGEQAGGIVGSTLYIINESFKGSDGHKGASLDNWYNLLVATGVKPSNFDDMRKVAQALTGRRLGIEVTHSEPTGPKKRVYANVRSYFPAAAMGDEGSGDAVTDDEPVEEETTSAVDLADIS